MESKLREARKSGANSKHMPPISAAASTNALMTKSMNSGSEFIVEDLQAKVRQWNYQLEFLLLFIAEETVYGFSGLAAINYLIFSAQNIYVVSLASWY
jgi:hypothetical protein